MAGAEMKRKFRKIFSSTLLRSTVLLLLAIVPVSRAFAQTTAGSIIGTLADPSGAILPDTDVTLINVETQDKRLARTNQDGHYQFVNIPPGRYSLSVQKAGFSKLLQGPVELQVGTTIEVNLAMQIGAADQTVNVTSATPLINVETTSLGTVIGQRQTTELPLNGRNPMNLTALVPSVVPQGGAMQNSVGLNPFAWGNYQIGGAFANQSATFLDGSPLNAEYINILALVPPQDSIQEFKVETNNLPAEFGRFSGGAINFTTKSGTNELHGSVWEFIRNKVFNANTFFAKRAGLGRPAFTQNQYGASVGGPVFIPHLYDGRNKTFFFVEYDGFALRNQSTFVTTVPTQAERDGDLSALGVNIYDPLSTCGIAGSRPCGAGQSLYDRTIFPNANISGRLNPVAVAYLKRFMPLPNTAGTNGANNWTGNSALGGDNHQIVTHIDQNISEKQHISARYNFWAATDKPNQPFGNGICSQRCGDRFSTNDFVISDTYAFSPKTIMDVRFSYLRFDYHRFPVLSNFDLTSIGLPASLQAAIQFPGPPTMEIAGFDPNGLFLSGSDAVLNNDDDNERIAGSLSKFIGNHTLKFGGEFLRGTYNFAQNNISTGGFAFNSGYTAMNPNTAVGGAGLASFLLGYPANGSGLTYPGSSLGYVVPVAGLQRYTGIYANDDWRVSSKLTLHMGLRWDNNMPWTERHNRLSYFDPTTPNPALQAAGLGNYPGTIQLVSSSTRSSRSNINYFNKQFSPRLGVSYEVTPSTVFSAGYGLLWLPNDLANGLEPNNDSLNTAITNYVDSTNGALTPTNSLSNPYPNGITLPPQRDPSYQQRLLGVSVTEAFPDNPYGYAQQWNAGIQQQFGNSFVFSVAYGGSKGTHIVLASLNRNQLPDNLLSLGNALLTQVPNPFYGVISPTNALGSSKTIQAGQLMLKYPQYTGVSSAGAGYGASTYNSLQIKAQKRFGHGASLNLAYTWSKLLSNTDTQTTWLESGTYGGIQDNNNLQAEKSLSGNDTPHRAVISYVYDLPFGHGQRFLSDAGKLVDYTIGGWGLEGITTLQSGWPLQFATNQNLTHSFGGGSRPNYTPGCKKSIDGPAQTRLTQWFNTSCFTQPAAFTFGNESRFDPNLRGAGQANWDISAFKNIPLTKEQRVSMQFRVESFNTFNRVQFGYPGGTRGSSNFGVVSTQLNLPRVIQFALRINY